MSRRRVWPVVRRVWITLGLGITAVLVVWSLIAYRADPEAREAWHAADRVRVSEPGEGLREFAPRIGDTPEIRFVFFPGALVDPIAYAPLMQAVAEAGYTGTLVALPRRGVFGGAESEELASRVSAALRPSSERQRIVVGGHSRGGVVASALVASHTRSIDGLVLIGTSHPRDVDLSGFGGAVTRYGFQPMDRRAQIGEAEQREIMIDRVLELLARVAASPGEEGRRGGVYDAPPPVLGRGGG